MFTVYPSSYLLVPSHLVPVLPARILLVPDFHLSSSAAQRPTSSVFAVRGIAPADSGYRRWRQETGYHASPPPADGHKHFVLFISPPPHGSSPVPLCPIVSQCSSYKATGAAREPTPRPFTTFGEPIPSTGGLFGCEILFHDACAVREFGMSDKVRHPAAPRVWRHYIIFCQNVAWRISVMRAASSANCDTKYFAVRMRVTLYVVWDHIQQNIISQPNRSRETNRPKWRWDSVRFHYTLIPHGIRYKRSRFICFALSGLTLMVVFFG